MNLSNSPSGLRVRVIVAGLLVVSAVVLFVANRVSEKTAARQAMAVAREEGMSGGIDRVIDMVLRRHGVLPGQVKSWQMHPANRRFTRTERRVTVPPDFIGLDFNLDLSRELERYDARVVGTERTKESSVIIHIVVNGKTIESISFITKQDHQ